MSMLSPLSLIVSVALLLLWGWVILEEDPAPIKHALARVRHAGRRAFIRREGCRLARLRELQLADWAAHRGYDKQLVEHVLRETHAARVEKLGTTAASQVLGPADEP